MKIYELAYIVSPEITSEEAEAKSKELESAIQSREGIILKQSNPTAKALAYPIAKRASGFFGVIEFQIESEKLIELKELIEKENKIVRHMIVVKEQFKARKERRTRKKENKEVIVETTSEKIDNEEKPAFIKTSAGKEKVELKDIEEKLEEILGQ